MHLALEMEWCHGSKRQPTVALSTMEAEYMVASHCTREAMWLRQLLDDVRCKYDEGTVIMCDNQGAIALAKNPVCDARTKHIEVQHHFVREKVQEEQSSWSIALRRTCWRMCYPRPWQEKGMSD
jgi:hypothetical protein